MSQYAPHTALKQLKEQMQGCCSGGEEGRQCSNSYLFSPTGCWSPYLVEQLGIRLPQYTFRHSYVVTERIEGVVDMPNIRDHELSIYLKVQGDVLQIGGYEPNPVILDEGVSVYTLMEVVALRGGSAGLRAFQSTCDCITMETPLFLLTFSCQCGQCPLSDGFMLTFGIQSVVRFLIPA